MKLFYVPKTRATRPRWMLEELGIPYELVRLDPSKGETRTAEHLLRQPLGHVPALEDGPVRMFESAAICLYLAEKYPERGFLAPPATPARAAAYQWLFYAATELEPPCAALSGERKKPEAERSAAVAEAARTRFKTAAAALEPILSRGEFLLGPAFTVADLVVGAVLAWGRALGALEDLPATEAYLARLRERPAWKRALAD
ncbi:MAG TPA: glutathione S-transferase family protein [Anaeromyxobacteraceae bacterium]|nr:glutathione S-transferase family protein [Anaeromyxobacteraceae bacterium]